MKSTMKLIWDVISFPLLFVGMQLILGVMISIPVAILVALGMVSFDSMNQWLVSIVGIPSFALTLLITWLILRKKWQEQQLWSAAFDRKSMLFVALGTIPIYFSVSFLLTLTRITEAFPEYYELMESMMGNSIFLDIVLVVILAPLVEEVIFRGVVMKRLLDRGVRFPYAIAIPALIFGVIHMNVVQGIYAFVLGIILGLVYYWTKTLWAPILMHLIFNGMGVFFSHVSAVLDIETASGSDPTLLLLTLGSLTLAVVLMYHVRRRSRLIDSTMHTDI